jgi:Ser/Thr protein kinase RdoA (MazF antagonist)
MPMNTFPIAKSFLSAEALARTVEAAYGLSAVHCQLLTATMRDVYRVSSAQGRFILYIYRAHQRTAAEIRAEWQFVDFLEANGVPVATAGGLMMWPRF